MDKKEFTTCLLSLIELKNDEVNLNKAFKKFEPDFNYICFSRYENLIVKLLEIAMNDISNGWISYWIYELNCGKEAKIDTVTCKGKNVPIKTVDDLFNLIISGI